MNIIYRSAVWIWRRRRRLPGPLYNTNNIIYTIIFIGVLINTTICIIYAGQPCGHGGEDGADGRPDQPHRRDRGNVIAVYNAIYIYMIFKINRIDEARMRV